MRDRADGLPIVCVADERKGPAKGSSASRLQMIGGLVAMALALLAALAPLASAAPTAGRTFGFSHSMASEGQLEIEPGFSGANPNEVGVDPQTGDVLVAARGELQIYAPGAGPSDLPISTVSLNAPRGIQVAPNGDVYAEVGGGTELIKLLRNPGNPPTYTVDPNFSVQIAFYGSFALDPSTGDLLVPVNSEVQRVSPAGVKISTFLNRAINGISATQDGTVFVFIQGSVSQVKWFSPTGQFLGAFTLPLDPGGHIVVPSSLSYDPISDVVDVSYPEAGHTHVVGLNSAGEAEYTFDYPGSEATAGSTVDPINGRFYGALIGSPGGLQVFESTVFPGVAAPDVSAITPTGAHLRAEVDPGAGPPAGSFAQFEYSEDGGKTWIETTRQDDSGATEIQDNLNGLEPNFEYLVRAVAGTELARHTGPSVSFRTAPTAPTVATLPASSITESSAVLNGTLNPQRLPSSYHFEYGPTSSYGFSLPVEGEATAGSGGAARRFSVTARNLMPATTYHFRIVAKNSAGQRVGEDLTFTTAPAGSEIFRAFEQVTPVDKNGGTIRPVAGFEVAPTGTALSYQVISPSGGLSSPLDARFNATRGSDGWSSTPTDPPLAPSYGTVFWLTLAISSDFQHAFVISNRALAPGAVEGHSNLYRLDLTTRAYSLVATDADPGAFDRFTDSGFAEKFWGGNSDLSTIFFISDTPLFPGVSGSQLYRWTESGGLELASRLPGGAIPAAHVRYLASNFALPGTTSADATRSYFTLIGGSNEAGVYLNEEGTTRAISVSQRAGDTDVPHEGELLSVSQNGRYAFFSTFSAQLTEDAPAEPGNVYRYDANTGKLEYIGQGNIEPFVSEYFANVVNPDGSTFAFAGASGFMIWHDGQLRQVAPNPQGRGSVFLTPDGLHMAYSTGELEADAYLYDVQTGASQCATCLPDGSLSHAAQLPESTNYVSRQQPSPLDADGDLFFTSSAALLPSDTNGAKDVYELRDGQLHLISPGTQSDEAIFSAVSEDGRDVYFTTSQQLVRQDRDQALDIYDARVDGGLPGQNAIEAPPCSGAGCRGPVAGGGASSSQSSGSETLRGSGNVKKRKHGKSCPKGKRAVKAKGKTRCVGSRHKQGKRHHRTPKTANHNRRHGR